MNQQGGQPGDIRRPVTDAAGSAARGAPRRVRADALLDGMRELIIEHGAEEYRLRLTSKGKLILTK